VYRIALSMSKEEEEEEAEDDSRIGGLIIDYR
jgi:hypothetical protein